MESVLRGQSRRVLVVTIAAFAAILSFDHVNAGKCGVNQPCGGKFDCLNEYSCLRRKGNVDNAKNCRCYAEPDALSARINMGVEYESCWNYQESPKDCIFRGSCGAGAKCGLARDCRGDLVCYKKECANAKDTGGETIDESGRSPNMGCHYGNSPTGWFANLKGY